MKLIREIVLIYFNDSYLSGAYKHYFFRHQLLEYQMVLAIKLISVGEDQSLIRAI